MKELFALVDTFSQQVVAVRRMSKGEAMQFNLLYATQFAFWTVSVPDGFSWEGGR